MHTRSRGWRFGDMSGEVTAILRKLKKVWKQARAQE